jgi:hypothetical protein
MPALIALIEKRAALRHSEVKYRKINSLWSTQIPEEDRPFVKRWPYRIENEYRVIFESNHDADADRRELTIPISMDSIFSITFNQNMPKQHFDSVKKRLSNEIQARVSHSTLFENKIWINKLRA